MNGARHRHTSLNLSLSFLVIAQNNLHCSHTQSTTPTAFRPPPPQSSKPRRQVLPLRRHRECGGHASRDAASAPRADAGRGGCGVPRPGFVQDGELVFGFWCCGGVGWVGGLWVRWLGRVCWVVGWNWVDRPEWRPGCCTGRWWLAAPSWGRSSKNTCTHTHAHSDIHISVVVPPAHLLQRLDVRERQRAGVAAGAARGLVGVIGDLFTWTGA